MDAADRIAILVPGAHAAVSIFDPAEAWAAEGYALVRYRFPGLDGRPVHPPLDISEAAREIADFVAAHGSEKIRLLGYSTGGAIALDAAALIGGDALRVALMSAAVEKAGGVATGFRGALDVAGAALRVRSVDVHAVWLEYYKTLLFGREDRENPKAKQFIDERLDEIVMPDEGKPRAHTDDLRRWRLPALPDLPAEHCHLFVGLADPVFSLAQTRGMAQNLGGVAITGYPGHGHLLFLTEPRVFEDVLDFFEDRPFRSNAGRAVGAGNSD
ncbi:alpha/beta hydrolase [uncultured Roseobacter sp.]|uniref:alpha/beta fold hydrolase n=1 Tax=uncultured Roseobacter sp. TaxID=114847 RepID=UPI00262CA970|nr:alpha/beta hydrolase [uncultured Roseobacter sp.]